MAFYSILLGEAILIDRTTYDFMEKLPSGGGGVTFDISEYVDVRAVYFSVLPSLRERLRTHKDFTKYQCFYLNYHKFSIKHVLDVY